MAYAAQCWNFIVRQGRSGQSLGKQLMGTRLIATSNLAAPGKAACFARSLALLVDVGFFGIGLLSIAFSQRRTSFGDRLAGTVVIDERRAGATIAWAVPDAPSHTRGAPEPHGAVPGWQPPSAWRRWLASLRSPPPAAPPQRSGVIDAQPLDQNPPPLPALPTLDDDEETPARPRPGADASSRPPGHVPPGGDPDRPGDDRSAEEGDLDSQAPQPSANPYLAARLERLAVSRGLPRPAHFLTEDVVDALEAGDLDEAFLFAGRQARRHLRQTPPEPAARREAAAELVADFARLAQLLEADTGLSTGQIRRRLGLARAFEDDAEETASPPPAPGPSPGQANGYLGPAAGRIATALAAGRSRQADEMARQRLQEVFDSGAPVSLETAIADYRRLLHASGVRDLDNASVARRLGLDHQS